LRLLARIVLFDLAVSFTPGVLRSQLF